MTIRSRRGVTLIEALITIVISAIALFALVPPFLAEGSLFRKGKRQTEAQRDAQLALRAMARQGRHANSCSITPPTPTSVRVMFVRPAGVTPAPYCFLGFPTNLGGDGRFFFNPGCADGFGTVLIDGVRSRLEEMTAEEVPGFDNRLLRVHLRVSHRLRTTDPFQEHEILDTELFLRNGPTS